jgi:Fe-S oxidoreductase
MSGYDHFVLPFTLGMYTLLIIFIVRVWEWIRRMPHEERMIILKGIFSIKVFGVMGEILMESLLHRRIFKVNKRLGYMHMSLAFGWFLLIVVGSVEAKILSSKAFNYPWDPIFLKYFNYDTSPIFNHIMDALLLFVISGVMLAILKRIRSRILGLSRTTKQRAFDKFAITALWLIFPLRLLAESTTAGMYLNGGFMTNSIGYALGAFLPLEYLEYTAWWAYSLAVGTFFVALPFSRYMHIPTEIVLIALRRFGFRTNKSITSFTEIEVYSCPRCGICIDQCQLVSSLGHKEAPPVYFLSSIRKNRVKADRSYDCLSCGRCQEICPVGINLTGIRELERERFVSNTTNFSYLKPGVSQKARTGYYAGCMTHLTPAIKKAMLKILNAAGEDYVFLDEDGSACCGRPMMLTGNYKAATELMEFNRHTFQAAGISELVTSCAICYKVFKEDYQLGIPVLHHSEYLLGLVGTGRIKTSLSDINAVYHDPCDLGRGSGIYQAPRDLLSHMLNRNVITEEGSKSLCCGGSLSNLMLSQTDRDTICRDALKVLEATSPDILVTACPLCKKTFARNTSTPVRDIAEVLEMCL